MLAVARWAVEGEPGLAGVAFVPARVAEALHSFVTVAR